MKHFVIQGAVALTVGWLAMHFLGEPTYRLFYTASCLYVTGSCAPH
jgi:hypothetical protein